jgi:hypothetical protein
MTALTEVIDESQQAAQLVKQALRKKLVPVLTDPAPTPATVSMQLQQLCETGITVMVPHVESFRRAAEQEIAALLAMPDLSHSSKRSGYIEKLLTAHLMPLEKVKDALKFVARILAKPGSMPKHAVYVNPVYELMAVVFQILGGATNGSEDVEFAMAKKTFEDQNALSALLLKWEPFDASIEQLKLARNRLFRLSPLMFQSDGAKAAMDLRSRTIFAWAALATALPPLLLAAKELCPLQTSVKKALYDMKIAAECTSQAEAEEAAWAQVRQALHRSGKEPWRWLELIGCKDAKGFYTRHHLAVDDSGSSHISADARGRAPEATHGSEEAPELSKRTTHFEEDDFEDAEQETPAKALAPEMEKSELQTQSSFAQDFSSMTHNTESKDAELISPQSGAYSDHDFETADEFSPTKSSPTKSSPTKSANPEYQEEFEEPSSVQQANMETDYTAEFDEEEGDTSVAKRQVSSGASGDEFEDSKEDAPCMVRQSSRQKSSEDEFEADDDEVQTANRQRIASSGSMEFEEDNDNDNSKTFKQYDSKEFEGDDFEGDEDDGRKREDGQGYDDFEDED